MRVFDFTLTAEKAIQNDIARSNNIDHDLRHVVHRGLLSRPNQCVQTDLMDKQFCFLLHSRFKRRLEQNCRSLIKQKETKESEKENGYKKIRDELSKLNKTIHEDSLLSVFNTTETLISSNPTRSVSRKVRRVKNTIKRMLKLTNDSALIKHLSQILQLVNEWKIHFEYCTKGDNSLSQQIDSINLEIESARRAIDADLAKLDSKKISFFNYADQSNRYFTLSLNAGIDEKISDVLRHFLRGYSLSVEGCAVRESHSESKERSKKIKKVAHHAEAVCRSQPKYFYVNVEDTKARELLWYSPDFNSQQIDHNEYPVDRLNLRYDALNGLYTRIQNRIAYYLSDNDSMPDGQNDVALEKIIFLIKRRLHDVNSCKDFICCFFDEDLEQMIKSVKLKSSKNSEKRALIERFRTTNYRQPPYYFTLAHRNAPSEIRSFFNLRRILTDKLKKDVKYLFQRDRVVINDDSLNQQTETKGISEDDIKYLRLQFDFLRECLGLSGEDFMSSLIHLQPYVNRSDYTRNKNVNKLDDFLKTEQNQFEERIVCFIKQKPLNRFNIRKTLVLRPVCAEDSALQAVIEAISKNYLLNPTASDLNHRVSNLAFTTLCLNNGCFAPPCEKCKHKVGLYTDIALKMITPISRVCDFVAKSYPETTLSEHLELQSADRTAHENQQLKEHFFELFKTTYFDSEQIGVAYQHASVFRSIDDTCDNDFDFLSHLKGGGWCDENGHAIIGVFTGKNDCITYRFAGTLCNHKFTYGQLKFEDPKDIELSDDNRSYPHGTIVRQQKISTERYSGRFTGVQSDGTLMIENGFVDSFGFFQGGVSINQIGKFLDLDFVGWGYSSQPVFAKFIAGDEDIQDRSPMQDTWGYFQCNASSFFINGSSRFWGLSHTEDCSGSGKFGVHISNDTTAYYIGSFDSEEPYMGILHYMGVEFGLNWDDETPEDWSESELKVQLWHQFVEHHSGFAKMDLQAEDDDLPSGNEYACSNVQDAGFKE